MSLSGGEWIEGGRKNTSLQSLFSTAQYGIFLIPSRLPSVCSTMRSRTRSLALLLLGLLLVGAVVVPRVVRFVRIFGPHSGPALTQEEIEAAYDRTRGTDDAPPQRIPKIIHQIFHNWRDPGNETIPPDWDAVRETCRVHNPDFEHRLWTESASLAFVEEHYPWFLDTYRGYRFPVQRVDALRYFLMLKIGGFYIDLDNVSLFLLSLVVSRCICRSPFFRLCHVGHGIILGHRRIVFIHDRFLLRLNLSSPIYLSHKHSFSAYDLPYLVPTPMTSSLSHSPVTPPAYSPQTLL